MPVFLIIDAALIHIAVRREADQLVLSVSDDSGQFAPAFEHANGIGLKRHQVSAKQALLQVNS